MNWNCGRVTLLQNLKQPVWSATAIKPNETCARANHRARGHIEFS
jgi:hypothetical protein